MKKRIRDRKHESNRDNRSHLTDKAFDYLWQACSIRLGYGPLSFLASRRYG